MISPSIRKVLAPVSWCIILAGALLGQSTHVWATTKDAPAKISTAAYQTPTDDGDDDDDDPNELFYHWMNPVYSRDEQRQMGFGLIFLGLVGAYSYAKGGKRSCPPQQ